MYPGKHVRYNTSQRSITDFFILVLHGGSGLRFDEADCYSQPSTLGKVSHQYATHGKDAFLHHGHRTVHQIWKCLHVLKIFHVFQILFFREQLILPLYFLPQLHSKTILLMFSSSRGFTLIRYLYSMWLPLNTILMLYWLYILWTIYVLLVVVNSK